MLKRTTGRHNGKATTRKWEMSRLWWVNGKRYFYVYNILKIEIEYIYIYWIYVFVYSLCFEYVCGVFLRCVEDSLFYLLCVCVFFYMYCMFLNLSSEFVLWNSSWTKWLIESKELLCSILHPSTTTKGIMVPNSPCQPPWLTWNFWMITLWQLVGFYVSMPCSQKVCKYVKIHQHQHGTYLALIPLMDFNMGALTWNPILIHINYSRFDHDYSQYFTIIISHSLCVPVLGPLHTF